jgi:hypothetical protein
VKIHSEGCLLLMVENRDGTNWAWGQVRWPGVAGEGDPVSLLKAVRKRRVQSQRDDSLARVQAEASRKGAPGAVRNLRRCNILKVLGNKKVGSLPCELDAKAPRVPP